MRIVAHLVGGGFTKGHGYRVVHHLSGEVITNATSWGNGEQDSDGRLLHYGVEHDGIGQSTAGDIAGLHC